LMRTRRLELSAEPLDKPALERGGAAGTLDVEFTRLAPSGKRFSVTCMERHPPFWQMGRTSVQGAGAATPALVEGGGARPPTKFVTGNLNTPRVLPIPTQWPAKGLDGPGGSRAARGLYQGAPNPLACHAF